MILGFTVNDSCHLSGKEYKSRLVTTDRESSLCR